MNLKYETKIITFKEETEYILKKSRFKVSAGWTLHKEHMALLSPENDLVIYFVQMPFVGDFEELALKAWKSVDPNFNLKVLQQSTQPVQDGWEKLHGIQYDVPTTESRLVAAQVRVFQGVAYINLIDGSLAGLSRRGAQAGLAMESWRPEALKREDLSGKKAKDFTQTKAKALASFIEDGMKQLDVPGLAIQIVQNNNIVFSQGFGVTKEGSITPVTPQSLFMIGSITKSLTSLMMAKLVDLGKMDWNTPVIKALPNFTLADADLTKKLLMKHTVSASTGMPRRDAEMLFAPTGSGENVMKQLETMAPTTGFGETFQYSNHLVALGGFSAVNGYKNLGTLGEKYESAMQELIFNPLDMRNTVVYPSEQSRPNMAYPHALNFNDQMASISQSQEDWVYPYAPAGSVWSNVEDMIKYVMLELNKGLDAQGTRVISEEQIMHRRNPGIKITDDSSYGLGILMAKEKGLNVVGHNGGTLGFASELFFLPEHNLGVVILTNSQGGHGLTVAIKQRLFELLFDAQQKAYEMIINAVKEKQDSLKILHDRISVDPANTAWITDYVGTYHSAELGIFTIIKSNKGFELHINNHIQSLLGSKKDTDGTLLISSISEPFIGFLDFQVQKEPVKKLILDMAQMKYEFVLVQQGK